MAGDGAAGGSQVSLVTGGYDHTIKLWQAHSGVCLRTMQHPDSVRPSGVSSNIRCQKIFQVPAPVNAVMLHPDQSQIMVGDQSGIIHIWDLKTDQNEQLIPEAEASIQDIAIDPTGKMMAAVNNKGNCYVWSLGGDPPHPVPRKHIAAHTKYALRDWSLLQELRHDTQRWVWDAAFSIESRYLFTALCTHTKAWRTSDWSLRHDTQRWVWDAAFSIESRYLFTGLKTPTPIAGSSDSYARLWNVQKGTLEREYCGHQKAITALAFKDQAV
ncbi:putative G protein beta subunit-like protein [Operophtera brumata]|uniref:Target of rapamycin complex subunit lst8 n=1 Tax=Operophtera brumata TaxID=104452 RepID=A0A0L7L9B3_OPEBR|nr:putative G protein beta subunit-like protein [Operophtera brumata]